MYTTMKQYIAIITNIVIGFSIVEISIYTFILQPKVELVLANFLL